MLISKTRSIFSAVHRKLEEANFGNDTNFRNIYIYIGDYCRQNLLPYVCRRQGDMNLLKDPICLFRNRFFIINHYSY